MNKVFLTGRLVKAVELRYTKDNLAIAHFTLAVNRNKKDEADFLNCIAYGNQAELITRYLDKGSKVAVDGHIQTGPYEKDGKKVYTTDIAVDKIEFLSNKQE